LASDLENNWLDDLPSGGRAMHKKYYPLFVSLNDRVCLVVGGGKVAERKIRTLLDHGAIIRMVARQLTPWLRTQCQQQEIVCLGEQYESGHLDDVDLVFVATDDAPLNHRIAFEAHEKRLWCNMAGDPQLGSCVVPALVERGSLSIAISTSGISPASARLIRAKLEQDFAPEWAPLLVLLGSIRTAIQQHQLGTLQNQLFFREVAKLPLLEWIRTGRQGEAVRALHQICQPWLTLSELSTFWKDACESYSSSSPPPAT
jgi:precorrin-2 dehydrogenase / sirohydrochlorin ferrochelatase